MAQMIVTTSADGRLEITLNFSAPLPKNDDDIPYEDAVLIEAAAGMKEHLISVGIIDGVGTIEQENNND